MRGRITEPNEHCSCKSKEHEMNPGRWSIAVQFKADRFQLQAGSIDYGEAIHEEFVSR